MEYTTQLLNMVIVLGMFVVGLSFLLKKMKKGRFAKESANQKIKIKDGITIGMGQSMYLVNVEGENVLLAVSSNGIHMIKLEGKDSENTKSEFDESFNELEKKKSLLDLTRSMGGKIKNGK